MKLYIVKEGNYKSNWKVKESLAFKTRKALHDYMGKKLGFKCVRSDDAYSVKGNRFVNTANHYGYDIIPLELYSSE